MPKKPTLSGRVPEALEERFETYREHHDLTKSEAMRRLLEAGLDSEERGSTFSELTRTEEWARDKLESWVPIALVTGSATAGLFVIFMGLVEIFNVPITPQSTFGTVFGVIFLIVIAAFVGVTAGSIVLGLLLKTGVARGVDETWLTQSTGKSE
jgi:hypothetical protein